MKLLKETTKARYSNTQLLKHLDRLSDFVAQYNGTGTASLRVDFAYGTLFKYDYDAKCYYFACSIDDRDNILDLIHSYSAHVQFIKTHNMSKN